MERGSGILPLQWLSEVARKVVRSVFWELVQAEVNVADRYIDLYHCSGLPRPFVKAMVKSPLYATALFGERCISPYRSRSETLAHLSFTELTIKSTVPMGLACDRSNIRIGLMLCSLLQRKCNLNT